MTATPSSASISNTMKDDESLKRTNELLAKILDKLNDLEDVLSFEVAPALKKATHDPADQNDE